MTVHENAYAKVNLYLDVTGRRDDGFHDILSVMHSVDLYDKITLTSIGSDKTKIRLTCSDPKLPCDESNLVYCAAAVYLRYFGINAEVEIHLEKKIPMGAGLGGGSADAAATLRAMNKIFRMADTDQLFEMATELGSDVPFCVLGGLSVCVGRGEKFTQLPVSEQMVFVIAIGESRVSTPKAYAALDKLYNNFTARSSDEVLSSNERILNMIHSNKIDIPNYNIFEQVILIDEIDKIKELMIKNGAENVLMSGSGPSVFCLCKDISIADNIRLALENSGFEAYSCTSIYPEDFI